MHRVGWAVGATLASAILLCGCAPSDPRSTGTASTPAATARALLATIPLPPEAKRVTTVPEPLLDKPWSEPACTPLIDASEWALVSGMSAPQVKAWLLDNPPSALAISGGGSAEQSGVDYMWTLSATWSGHYPQLSSPPTTVDTIIPAGKGAALRVDVQAIPKGSSCTSAGGSMSGGASSGGSGPSSSGGTVTTPTP